MVVMKTSFKKEDILSGDILVWGDVSNGKGSIYLKLVRLLTISDYGHISIAWRTPAGTLTHVEATQPVIRRSIILPGDTFYCIPTGLNVENEKMEKFFRGKLGSPYSFRDAVFSYLGLLPKEDNRWQCVELANVFCKEFGIDLGDVYIPNEFVRAMMDKPYSSLRHIPPDSKRTV